MTFEESDAWIFLAIEQVAPSEGVTVKGISDIADGINHAVPSEKEMGTAFKRLSAAELIEKKGKKYYLTEAGKQLSDSATSPTLLARLKEFHKLLNGLYNKN